MLARAARAILHFPRRHAHSLFLPQVDLSRYPTITGPVPLPGDERNADYTTSNMHRYSNSAVVTTDPALQTAPTGRTIIMFTARVAGINVSTRSSFTGKFASRLQRYTSRALTRNCWPRMGQFTRYAQDTARSAPPSSPPPPPAHL